MTRGRAATWFQRHFGLPGRSWAPARTTGWLGLLGLGVVLLATWLLSPGLATVLQEDLPGALAAFALVWWATAHPLPLRTAAVRTYAVLDSGVLVILLTSYGALPGLGLWLVITVVAELARKHFLAIALVNAGIAMLASALATVVSVLLLGWNPVWTGYDARQLVLSCALVGAVHALSEAGITELAVRYVSDSHPPTRFSRAGLILALGAGTGALAAVCTYSDEPAAALLGLSVPMLLLVTLVHTRAQRRTAIARDRILVQALTELARSDDAAGIDAILHRAMPHLAPAVTCELTTELPGRPRRSEWFAIGGTGDGSDPVTDDRWIRADLLPAEVYLPDEEASALRSLAAVARAAAVRIRERSEMAWAAEHDPLTGLLNRNGYWQRQVDRAGTHRQGEPLAIVIADLDGFKGVNDAYGHARGDELLLVVARAIHLTAPVGAVVARWGGDEFVIRLDAPMSEDAVAELGHALVEAVERSALEVVPPGLVSASVGYAVTDDTERVDAFDLLHHADECMYAAKRAGKATVRGRAA